MGYSKEELFETTWDKISYEEDIEKDIGLFNDVLSGKINNYQVEKRFVNKDGEIVETILTLSAYKQNNKIKYLLASILDITDSKMKENLLVQQSKLAAMGEMIGNIAHQWRQPLTELSLTLFNMKKASLKNDEKKVDELYKESKTLILNMSSTIEDFTNFFNPQKEKKSFEIKDAINEALIILRKVIEIENIHIQIDVPINYKVIGVSNELSQVIVNLIQNSKDAFIQNNIEHKTIEISLKEKQQLDKKYALLEIKDNAGGIDKENIEKVFDPYFTTKYKSQGTGLGLFMSKMIIEKSLEGELSHENIDDGSTFKIKLILG